ncbi:MAG: ead/Ea22-like family protein [Klebsiella michiganensis]|nr:ead/Ea22-like family protein [Klebsiella michiganensis]
MTTDITELAQSLKAAAEKATPGPWGVARDGKTLVSNQSHPIATVSDAMHRMLADGSTGKDAEFIALANPANILALVEALEKAQAGEKQWREVVDAFCADDADWHKLTNSNNELIALLSQALCKQADRIAELESRTVKLPKRSVGEVMHMSGFSRDYAEGWCSGNDNAIHEMRAAGIKVEGE